MSDTATPTETATDPHTGKAAGSTEYVLLHSDPTGRSLWRECYRIEARSAEAAIRGLVELEETADGTWLAIPLRSWRPVTVTEKKTVTLELKPAS